MARRVYVKNFDWYWSLPLDGWEALCRHCAETGDGYDLNDPSWGGIELRSKPKGVGSYRDTDGTRYYFALTNDVVFREPLDWERSDFVDEVRSLQEARACKSPGAYR